MRSARHTLLLSLLLLSAGTGLANAQITTVLDHYREYLFRTVHVRPDRVKRLTGTVSSTGRWPDIDYRDESRANWQLLIHLKRLDTLSVAWSNPASSFYHKAPVWKAISLALNDWLKHKYRNPNWWHNQIGVPQCMRDIIILLKDLLSSRQLQQALVVMDQLKVQKNGYGANTIWSADLGFHYAALTGNLPLMDSCWQVIINEIHISHTTRQGIQPDYSFHQHGSRLQMYQYGKAYLFVSLRLAWELRGTRWAFPQNKTDILLNFILKGWQWMARGIHTVPGTMDRSASRKGELHSPDIRFLIPFLTELAPGKTRAFRQLAACQNGKRTLQGFRYYPYSDFAAYQNKDFSFFLKTISTRTLPTEVGLNSENLKGQLLNSGDAYLISNEEEYYNLMPVWNWQKLPGITAFKGAARIRRKPFTGSVGNGKAGLTAMDYCMENKTGDQEITAHKIWACHGNTVVCLTAGLTGENLQSNIYTVLDQCRLQGKVIVNDPGNEIKAGDHTFKNVKWIWHHGFAYLPVTTQSGSPQQDVTINLKTGPVTGNWSSINASESDAPVMDAVFMPVMTFNKNIHDGSTGYVLAYCRTPQAARSICRRPDWIVLRNDSQCQAVKFKDGTVMAAFFKGGTLKAKRLSMKADKPCLVLMKSGHLSISNPSHGEEEVTIDLNGKKITATVPADGSTKEVQLN